MDGIFFFVSDDSNISRHGIMKETQGWIPVVRDPKQIQRGRAPLLFMAKDYYRFI